MLCSHLIYKKGFLLHHPLLLNLWWLWSISVLKGQKWNSDILTKQSKPSLAKSSSKLFFVGRLRGKKCKSGGSSKVLQDTSNTLDTSQPPAQGPQKVRRPGAFIWRSLREHSCIQDQTTFAVLFLFIYFKLFVFLFQRLSPDMLGDDGFFDLLSRFQSNRMDDQRCSIQDRGSRLSLNSGPESPPRTIRKCRSMQSTHTKNITTVKIIYNLRTYLLSFVAMSESANVSGAQGRRLEESSAAGGSLPGLRLNQNSNQAVLSHLMANADSAEPDDDFFDMLVKCQVTEKA